MMPMNKQMQVMLQRMMAQNPQAQQMMQMVRAKTPAEQKQLVEKLCKERGTTVEELARSFGIQIPSER